MVLVHGEVDVSCICPECGHQYIEPDVEVEIDIDLQDYRSDGF